MNETKKNKREWIKTAAIVFLSIMLVLTFFSNTIMNYSLPEVATKYVQPGTITAKIRGTGTIESGDPYAVQTSESRKVDSVVVRVGDQVQKGDVLMYLESGDSKPLQDAKAELKAAQDAYDQRLLEGDLTQEDVSAAGQNVSANANYKKLSSLQEEISALDDSIAAYDKQLKEYDDKIFELDQTLSAYSVQTSYDTGRLPDAQDKAAAANDALTQAETAYQTAQENVTTCQNAYNTISGQLSDAQATDPVDEALVADLTAQLAAAQTDLDNANTALAAADTTKQDAQTKAAAANKLVSDITNCIANISASEKVYVYNKGVLTNEKNAIEKQKNDAVDQLTAKQTQLTELIGKFKNIEGLQQLMDALKSAKEKVRELEEKLGETTVTADKAGTVTEILYKAGETIVTDSMSGKATVVMLQPEGKGATLSFSVTNEQARRLSVGAKADLVNAWRYDDVEVVLTSIKPDKSDPGRMKQLTFEVTGDVIAGQTLSVSVGDKSSNYDYIVPNSAIREDNNGKFILIVESKSSPLGNRYVATRADVEVIASDDTQSAISGGVMGYEYVITTANKPVNAGDLVRLTEN